MLPPLPGADQADASRKPVASNDQESFLDVYRT